MVLCGRIYQFTFSGSEEEVSEVRKMKLATKLIIGGLLVISIPLAALSLFCVHRASTALDELGKDQLSALSRVAADQINGMLAEQTRLLVNASANDSVIRDIAETMGSTGVSDMVQLKLETNNTVFHDKEV